MTTPTNIIDQTALLSEIEALKKENEKLKQCKRYGLVWEDHPEALDKKNIIPLLAKDDGLSLPVISDKKQNYLIEGDNYHALKALQHTHRSAIDVIYIDPPYNTGNEFVYNDKIVDKEDSFRHSKWLSFMEKRLKLARELMSDDGVIFISIDEYEFAQLKLLLDSIFGEVNFIENFIWMKNSTKNNSKTTSTNHEYILCYAKNIDKIKQIVDYFRVKKNGYDEVLTFVEELIADGVTHEEIQSELQLFFKNNKQYKGISAYKYVDDEFNVFTSDNTSAPTTGSFYDVIHPVTMKPCTIPKTGWRYKEETMVDHIRNNRILFGETEKQVPRFKRFLTDVESEVQKSVILDNTDGKKELMSIFDGFSPFDNPKPITLIDWLLKGIPNKSATVLDFFAGSGTTGHTVMELNKEDGGDRNFILCTNNEVSDDLVRTHFFNEGHIKKNNKTEFNKFVKEHPDVHQAFLESEAYESLGIARAVTRERIKRVIEGYTTPKGKDIEGLPNNLTYLKTKEFDKKEQYGFDRNLLADLAYNSHILKYPELNYESFQVDAFTDIDAIKLTTSKQPVAFVNTRDRESLADIVEQLTIRFGNKVIIETLESYFN